MPDTQEPTTIDLSPTRRIRVRKFALLCAKEIRLGKFKRFSPTFSEAVDAAVEKLRRDIAAKYGMVNFPDLLDTRNNACVVPQFLTKHEKAAIIREIEFMIARLVQRKVEQHPTRGKTLT